MSKHTPGPWIIGENEQGPDEDELNVCRDHEGGPVICRIWPMGQDFDIDENGEREDQLANARLIAAAPELLDVCQQLLYDINGRNATLRAADRNYASTPLCEALTKLVGKARAAIERATGN